MAYSQKQIQSIFKTICSKIAIEGMSLRTILQDKDMPDAVTFYKWLESDKEKIKQYARATELRADSIFDEILDISDDNSFDVSVDDEGNWKVNGELVQRSKLKIDSRKWILSKMNPKKYSDKIQVDTSEFKEQPLFPE